MSKYHNNEVMKIDHFTLLVKDITRSVKFYQDVLGMDLVSVVGNKYNMGIGNKILFTLVTNSNVTEKTRTTGLYHFALLLPKRSDLGSLLYHFVVNNIKIQGGSDHGVSEAVYLADPDNNGIEIYIDKDDNLWPFNKEGLTMVSEYLNYDELIMKRTSDESFKMPSEAIIGHMHFHVSDILKAKDFYINALGFQLMQDANSAVFVSDGNYHHHLGFNIWNGRNIENRPENMAGLLDYKLSASSDKITNLIHRLKTKNILIEEDEDGRYIYDINNVKMYF